MILFAVPQLRGHREHPQALAQLLRNPGRTMASLTLGRLSASLGAAVSWVVLVNALLPAATPSATLVLVTILIVPVILLVIEVIPRLLTPRLPDGFIRVLARPLPPLVWLLTPLRLVLDPPVHGARWLVGGRGSLGGSLVAELEFKTLVVVGGPGGTLEKDEREMVEGVLDFGRTAVEEIMTPRTELEWVDVTDSRQDVVKAFEKTDHSRLLVCDKTPDKTAGFLHLRDLLLFPERPWTAMLRTPLVVPPSLELDELFDKFRTNRVFLAVVADEYGGTKGIATLNDVLEAVIGEIEKSSPDAPRDGGAPAQPIRPDGEGGWIVWGRVEIWDLNNALPVVLPDDRGRTLSGFVINSLGHIPEVGEELVAHGLRVRVLRMAGPRIEELQLSPIAAPASPPAAGSEEE
jgi:CBS domain containing-hemolysin-like protein